MTRVLGLTGGIATGKSTVSAYLASRGAVIIDGDLVARRVTKPNHPGLRALVATFGPQILDGRGELKRAELGQRVFGDPAAQRRLNQTLGPFIHQEIIGDLRKAQRNHLKLVVLDIPLLFEGGYQDYCDQVMVVTTSPATQLKRLMARNGYDRATAEHRIRAQWPLAKKAALADVVIDNEESPTATKAQVADWLYQWLWNVV